MAAIVGRRATDPPEPLAVVNARALLPDGLHERVTIVTRDGRIADVAPDGPRSALADARVIDVAGRLVTAGLVDIHVHGAAGEAFDGAGVPFESANEPIGVATLRLLAAAGVTSVLTSLVSAPVERLTGTVSALGRLASEQRPDTAEVLGVHLEGPFLAVAQCGAHDPAALTAPTPSAVSALLEHRDVLRMVTLAPELPGGIDAVRRFTDAGVLVAVGHSEAGVPELAAAVDAGARHLTHLWSGQSSTVRRGPWRVPGLLEASLASDGLTAEIIADGRHLPPTLLEIARRSLPDRLVIVSDGTPGTGMPAGYEYDLAAVRCVVADGVGMVVGVDAFGGSTTTLPQMLAHLHDDLGWPLADVVTAATSRPAAVVGVADRKGSIAVGTDADLAVFDTGFRSYGTVLRGRWLPASGS